MSVENDIAIVAEHERVCVFKAFDETIAAKIGMRVIELARAKGEAMAVDVRFWNRQLFFCAMPGIRADHAEWLRRKSNFVRRFDHSSYGGTLRQQGKDFGFDSGLDQMEIAAHGGSFPIRIEGVGVIGAITATGVPGRRDHGYVVEAICGHLGLDYAALALPPE